MIKAGDKKQLAGYAWTILKVNEKKDKVLLLCDEFVAERAFDAKSNEGKSSDLRDWLVNHHELSAISGLIETTLLSIKQYNKYKHLIPPVDSWWWLRTPGYRSFHVSGVSLDGSVFVHGYRVIVKGGVRPAIWVTLESLQGEPLSNSLFEGVLGMPKSDQRRDVKCESAVPEERYMGETLRKIRNIYGYTQKELAELLGLSPSYVNEIEKGKKEITVRFLKKFSEVTKLKLSSLLLLYEAVTDPKNLGKGDVAISNMMIKLIDKMNREDEKNV